MADGMKIADVYADFQMEIDKGIDQALNKLRGRAKEFDRIGSEHGDAFVGGFSKKTAGRLTAAIDKKTNNWAAVGRKSGENYATGFTNGVNLRGALSNMASTAKSSAVAYRVAGKHAGAEYAKGFGESGGVKVSAVGGADAAGEAMGQQLGKGFERGASRSVDKATEKVASRAQAQFKALQFAGAFAGLPVAAGVAALATSGILAGAGAGFIALAAVALSSNEDVKQSYTDLWDHVKSGARDAAQPLTDEFITAAHDIGAGFDKLQPQIARAMSASQPYVEDLVDSVLGFADNAMPGAVRAVERAQPVFNALQVASEDLGDGVTEMLDGMSTHSVAAGKGLQQFGDMGRDALRFVGEFIGNLSEGAAPALVTFDGALEKVYQTGITLSTTGLPTMVSAVQGFTQPIEGGLSILNGFASALGSWSEPLGNAAGQLWSTNMIMGLMGTSIGATVGGFKNLAAGVDEGGRKVGTFGEQVGKAEGKIGKVKAGFNALTNAGVNPLAIALGAVTLAMGLFGQAAEEAEQKQARFDQGVRNLRTTLDETTGAITAKTKATVADLAQSEKIGVSQKKAADLSREYGFSLQELSHIVTTGGSAMDAFGSKMQGSAGAALNASLSQSEWNTLAEAGISHSDLLTLSLGQSAAGFASLDDLVQKTSGSTDEYTQRLAAAAQTAATATQGQRDFATWVRDQNAQLAEAQKQLRATTDAASGMGGAFKLSAAASQQMSEALGQVGSDATSAKEQAQALMWILDKLTGSNISLSDAQSKSGEAIRQANEQIKAFKEGAAASVGDLVNAAGGINGLTEAGAQLNGVFTNLSGTALQEASAAFQEVHARGGSVGEQMSAIAGPVERARTKFIEAADAAGLNATEAANLANEMGLIPELVQIQILAKGSQEVAQKLLDIRGQLANIPTGTVNVDASRVAGAEQQLAALGYKLTALPNGQVRVTAPGANAVQQQITSIADQVNTMPAGKKLVIQAPTGEVQAALSVLGYTITNLPNGQVEITADTNAAKNEANALADGIRGNTIIAPMDLNTGGGGSTYGAFKMGIESVPVIAQLTANAAAAYAATGQWQGWSNSTVGTGTLAANSAPANQSTAAWWSKSNSTKATGTLAANNDQAMMALASWSAYVKASKPQGTITANISPAIAAWSAWQPASKTATVYVAKVGPGAALKDGGTVPAYADGGTIALQRFDGGGTIRGEGGPRQDRVMVAASPFEEIVNARASGTHRPLIKTINNGATPEEVAVKALREAGMAVPTPQYGGNTNNIQVDVHGYTGSADALLSKLDAQLEWSLRGVLD